MMCMEFWIGWFDHWGEPHITRTAEDVAAETEKILSCGASVNFYMGHGGTNFGYMAGANHTLPTGGTARFSSPLGVDDFIKKTQFICYSPAALAETAEDVAYFARKEGLTAHAESAEVRG